MSQSDILEVLKKKDRASAEEISNELGISLDAVRKSLNRLLKAKDVEKIILTKPEVEKIGIRFSGRHFLWSLHIENDK
jgi:predicted ArsR family transcriptional regulator